MRVVLAACAVYGNPRKRHDGSAKRLREIWVSSTVGTRILLSSEHNRTFYFTYPCFSQKNTNGSDEGYALCRRREKYRTLYYPYPYFFQRNMGKDNKGYTSPTPYNREPYPLLALSMYFLEKHG